MVIDEERISVPSVIRLVAVGTLSARAPAIFFFQKTKLYIFPDFPQHLNVFFVLSSFCSLRHPFVVMMPLHIYAQASVPKTES